MPPASGGIPARPLVQWPLDLSDLRDRGGGNGVATAATAPGRAAVLRRLIPQALLVLLQFDPRSAGNIERAVDGGQCSDEDDGVAYQ